MIVLLKDFRIHSIYNDIPKMKIENSIQQGFDFIEIPDDISVSTVIGELSPLEQNINNSLRIEIRAKTARLRRKLKEERGIIWNDFLIKTNPETVTLLETAKRQLEQNNILSVPWRFDDGNFRELTVNQLDDLIRVVSQAVQKNFLDEKNEVMS